MQVPEAIFVVRIYIGSTEFVSDTMLRCSFILSEIVQLGPRPKPKLQVWPKAEH